MAPLPLALAVVSTSFLGSGGALVLRRRAVASASLMVVGGLVGITASVLLGTGHHLAGAVAGTLTGTVFAPLVAVAYPELHWRRPPDFVALVVLGGCGIVSTAYLDSGVAGLMGIIQGSVLVAHTWWRIETATDPVR